MRKNEVIRFLQLVMYYEVLPLNAGETDYSEIGKYCLAQVLLTQCLTAITLSQVKDGIC